jgi:predicted ATP-dependent endonuclease of OLD family
MKPHYISAYSVKGLWGYKDYTIAFKPDVNIIIGPNASGKTTLINILYDALTANLLRLAETPFSEVVIDVREFGSSESQRIAIVKTDDLLHITVAKRSFKLPLGPGPTGQRLLDLPPEYLRRRHRLGIADLDEALRGLVPAVWLPVSRRLPIAEEEHAAQRRLHSKPLESVDECLAGLTENLQRYRLSLNSELAELRREFQRHALENILYDKQHDQWSGGQAPVSPSDADKQRLLQAFKDVGFVDAAMESRINTHFAVAREAVDKFTKSKDGVDINDLMILPLIARTQAMIQFAQELQSKRDSLFEPLQQFEGIVSDFLNEKAIKVSDRGELVVIPDRDKQGELAWRHLSSGEKQVLILLTQALLSAKSPAVYVADEPELSLHVTWQEKLLSSLTKLAGECQFIVATHSPDIAAGFGDKVIDLARI